MKIQFNCTYCDNTWQKDLWSKDAIEAQICPRCKDTTLKVRDLTNKVNYYPEDHYPEDPDAPKEWGNVD